MMGGLSSNSLSSFENKIINLMENSMVANGSLYTSIMQKLRFEASIDESRITVVIKSDGIVGNSGVRC